eukprot:4382915-Karenia_brevis.AAC.1
MIKRDGLSKDTRLIKRASPWTQCIALAEVSGALRVMLQAKDASGVEYRHLSPSERKIFDGARNKEMQGLFDLGAHR